MQWPGFELTTLVVIGTDWYLSNLRYNTSLYNCIPITVIKSIFIRLGKLKIQQKFKYGTFLTLSLKLMQWYVTSVSRWSLCEKFGKKMCENLKILENWAIVCTHKNRRKKIRLLGIDTCPSLNDIMEIRCNKCTRSEQGYDC